MKRLLICILLTGCASKPLVHLVPRPNIDPILRPSVELFESLYEVTVTMPVRVGATPYMKRTKHNAAGVCDEKEGITISTALIDEDYYDAIEEVVFHELGHCFFGREHDSTMITEGPMSACADSVMTDDVMLSDNHCWQQFKGHYVHELPKGHCRPDYVYGGVCPVKYNANPQFYHVSEGMSLIHPRFYEGHGN